MYLAAKLSTSVLLMANGAECDVRDKQGNTPVHLAVQARNLELIVYFVGLFPNVMNIPNASGEFRVSSLNFRIRFFVDAFHLSSCERATTATLLKVTFVFCVSLYSAAIFLL